jgi:hypothetical protein
MSRVLADTGASFQQWVALTITAGAGDAIGRSRLLEAVAGALVNTVEAEAAVVELEARGLLEPASDSDVGLTGPGRELHERISAAVAQASAPLYADLPPADLAAARRVLRTITERADHLLAIE